MAVLFTADRGMATEAHPSRNHSTETKPPRAASPSGRSSDADTVTSAPSADCPVTRATGVSSWTFGDLVFTRALRFEATARPCLPPQKSLLDHWCVVLARGDSEQRLSIMPAARPSPVAVAPRDEPQARVSEVLTLFLPRDICGEDSLDFEHPHEIEISPGPTMLLAGYMDSLARELPHVGTEQSESLAAATRALVAACIAPALGNPETSDGSPSSLLIDRVRLVVRQNMASPEFGPEQLARLLATSRSKLYRLFEKAGGVAHFINRERLKEAHRRLSSHRDMLSIHMIGTEAGFTDHSTFSRAFRREFGYSPTEARERALMRLAGRQGPDKA